jgi:type VI secretion system secreted protein VgrG
MPEFTQTGRPFRIDTPLGVDELLLSRFSGEEAVSRPFRFQLDLLSENAAIEPGDILRQGVAIEVELQDGSKRHFHGIVNRFSQGPKDEELTSYRAEMVPWLWFLSLRRDCRIFQELSVPDIVESIFQEHGYNDFDIRCSSRPQREFCVQYRESDLNFVQRLLEEEGIFYFFEHDADKHVLVLADANGSIEACAAAESVRLSDDPGTDEEVITTFDREHSARIGSVTYRDYDFLQPSFTLEGTAPGSDGEEVYDYSPGRYTTREEGDRLTKYRLEAEEVLREQVRGRSNCRGFTSGFKFKLEDHHNPSANQEYLLTSVQHVYSGADYRSARGGAADSDYGNQFTAVPMAFPFRPRRSAPKPVITGSQTAVVVGPPGEEIHTNEHGCVKLHFHWDRLGSMDENASCWIRVSHPWAGQGWGAVSIPRIGQEVVVDFLEGDPDQPIVVGRVYNAQQTPPYALPAGGNVSGIKSNSTPGGGGYNEMSMNDSKGKEKITIHAQYNMDSTVENDQTLVVHNNRTHTVDVDEVISIGANQSIEVGGNQTIAVKGQQDESVDGSRSDAVAGDETRDVGGSQTVSIGADRTVEVGGNDAITAGANMEHSAGANLDLAAGANLTASAGANGAVEAGANMDVTAGAMMNLTAGAKISLSAGGSTIELGPDGIKITAAAIVSINGVLVKIN